MLDIQQIRKHPKQIQKNFERRGFKISVEEILKLDREKRMLQKGDIISLAGECYSFH